MKSMDSHSLFRLLFIIIILSAVSCKDDDVELTMPQIEEGDQLTWSSKNETYPLNIKAEGDWTIRSNADWAYIPTSQREGNGNATINLYIEKNPTTESRSGDLIIELSADPSRNSQVHITQEGKANPDENSLMTNDLSKNYAVGFGYNAFGEYANVGDVKAQVLNYQKILDWETSYEENFASDESQYELEYTKTSAHSVDEYQKVVTTTSSSKTKILCYKKEVTKRTTTNKTVRTERNFATQSILNIIAQRYISESALENLIAEKKDVLTDAFKKDIEKVKSGQLSVGDFINTYGTHVVTTAYLGGRLDYTLSIEKTVTTEIKTVLTTTYKKFFKKESTTTDEDRKISQQIEGKYDCTCFVKGGKADALQADINKKLAKKEPIDNSLFSQWESSFNDAESSMKNNEATLIDTRTLPIYDLITDNAVKEKIAQEINRQSKLEENSFHATGDYVYYTDINESSLNNVNTVQKTVDNETIPIAEICLEYIPTIRTDKKVVVVYPIMADKKPDLTRGFFIGDGEGHTPGQIQWQNNRCTYTADYTYGMKEIAHRVFIYKYDIYGREEDYFPEQKWLGITYPKDGIKINNEIHFLFHTKLGTDYWAYLSQSCVADSLKTIESPNNILSSKNDIQRLKTFLANDFSPLFKDNSANGLNISSGNNHFWSNPTEGTKSEYFVIYPSGTIEYKTDKIKESKHFLFLRRSENFHY